MGHVPAERHVANTEKINGLGCVGMRLDVLAPAYIREPAAWVTVESGCARGEGGGGVSDRAVSLGVGREASTGPNSHPQV